MKLDPETITINEKINVRDVLKTHGLESFDDYVKANGQLFIDWIRLSKVIDIPLPVIHRHRKRWDWRYLLKYNLLPEDFIESHLKYCDMAALCKYQVLSDDFIRRHSEEVDWKTLVMFDRISDPIRQEFNHKIAYYERVKKDHDKKVCDTLRD